MEGKRRANAFWPGAINGARIRRAFKSRVQVSHPPAVSDNAIRDACPTTVSDTVRRIALQARVRWSLVFFCSAASTAL